MNSKVNSEKRVSEFKQKYNYVKKQCGQSMDSEWTKNTSQTTNIMDSVEAGWTVVGQSWDKQKPKNSRETVCKSKV